MAKGKEASTKATPCPAFENAWLLLCLSLLEAYPSFIHTRPQVGKKVMHDVIVWAICYNGDVPQLSPEYARRRLSGILSAAFKPFIYKNNVPYYEALNDTAAKQVMSNWCFFFTFHSMAHLPLSQILEFIENIRSLALMGESNLRSESGREFLLGPYRNFCQHLALDALNLFGDLLRVKAEVPPQLLEKATQDKEKEKEKEKESAKGSGKGKGKGKGKETPSSIIRGSPPPREKNKAVCEMIWRPEFESMLDQFCDDVDESVAWRALAIVTKAFQT